MKLNRISFIALGALLFTACSSDDDFNTAADVTVDMKLADYSIRESGNIFQLPIEVKGTANGPIVVYVETTPYSSNPAEADVNYSVTSNRIIIPEGVTTGYVEIQPIDNVDENDSRYFDVTIARAEGAQIGAKKTTLVEIKDNDQDPYEKMTGKWIFNCSSIFNNGDSGPMELIISTPDPDNDSEAEYYGHELYAYGLKGSSFLYVPLNFEYDEATDEIKMSIQVGSLCTSSIINFGFNGVVAGASVYAPGQMEFGQDIPLVVTRNGATVTNLAPVDPEAWFLLMVMEYPSMNARGYFDGWTDMSFSR